jgi:hypothetical protein
MTREADLSRFYDALDEIRNHVGGFRFLRDCTARTGWPTRGLYFFFEEGEYREGSDSLRVVRVGTHALTDTSRTKLWSRLSTHRGHADGRGQSSRIDLQEASWTSNSEQGRPPRRRNLMPDVGRRQYGLSIYSRGGSFSRAGSQLAFRADALSLAFCGRCSWEGKLAGILGEKLHRPPEQLWSSRR